MATFFPPVSEVAKASIPIATLYFPLAAKGLGSGTKSVPAFSPKATL